PASSLSHNNIASPNAYCLFEFFHSQRNRPQYRTIAFSFQSSALLDLLYIRVFRGDLPRLNRKKA
ncbi:MAG: hypothetical protein ACOVQM_07580, partial [Pirellula sp.]